MIQFGFFPIFCQKQTCFEYIQVDVSVIHSKENILAKNQSYLEFDVVEIRLNS